MVFDFKKEYRGLYLPTGKPAIVDVPEMRFLAVRGSGDPNEADGSYGRAVEALYGVAYTLKMSARSGHDIEGFFDYKVPPLEGFWWMEGASGIDYDCKQDLCWISVVRVPDFVGDPDFTWARQTASAKKKRDFSSVELLSMTEGLCVQCLHEGPFDEEPGTVDAMDGFARDGGFELDFGEDRHHHEIYLSDPRRCDQAKMRTVIRHPLRMA